VTHPLKIAGKCRAVCLAYLLMSGAHRCQNRPCVSRRFLIAVHPSVLDCKIVDTLAVTAVSVYSVGTMTSFVNNKKIRQWPIFSRPTVI